MPQRHLMHVAATVVVRRSLFVGLCCLFSAVVICLAAAVARVTYDDFRFRRYVTDLSRQRNTQMSAIVCGLERLPRLPPSYITQLERIRVQVGAETCPAR